MFYSIRNSSIDTLESNMDVINNFDNKTVHFGVARMKRMEEQCDLLKSAPYLVLVYLAYIAALNILNEEIYSKDK